MKTLSARWSTVLLLGLAASVQGELGFAAGHKHAPMPQIYRDECGGCHLPYAAEFLPANAWKALLGNLSKHFDVDAEMDPGNLKPINQYLGKHAGPPINFDPGKPQLKITQSRWFRQTHSDAARGHWPKIKSRSNCAACHPNAQQDDFVTLSDPNY